MEFTYEELKHKKIDELREIAKGIEHDAVQGYSQLNKDHLVPAICTALGIEAHEHHVAHGIGKAKVKAKISELKVERDKVLEAHDQKGLKRVRRKIHRLKHKLRAAAD
jgi:rubrerythrin